MEAVLLVIALAAGWRASSVAGRARAPKPAEQARAEPVRLSMAPPRPLPATAPRGQDARDLWFDTVPEHPGYGVTPDRVINAFRAAELGDPRIQCDLFDDVIEADCHLSSLFEKRSEAVAGKPWVIQAGNGDEVSALAAHVMREQLRLLPMDEVFQHLLTYNKYGYAAVEIDWTAKEIDGRIWIVPEWFVCVRARRFKIGTIRFFGNQSTIDELRLFADPTRPLGDELRAGKWIILRRDRAMPLAQSGLMRSCIWPALGKRYSFRDWLVLGDKYGKPVPIASYQEDADDQAKSVAMQIVQNIGNDNGAIKPETIKLDFQETKADGSSKLHGSLIQFCNSEMSKRVNGSTLANDNSNSGGASYALGAVHDSVRWEAVQYDATRLQTAFKTCVFEPFVKYNNLNCAPPELKIQVARDLDPNTRVEVAAIYRNQLGGKVSRAQMGEELGFREPTGPDDELPGTPATTPVIGKVMPNP